MKLSPIAANMTEITVGPMTVLFSYKTPVAAHIEGVGAYKTETKWSTTTTRHINKWARFHNFHKIAQTKPQEFFDNLLHVE